MTSTHHHAWHFSHECGAHTQVFRFMDKCAASWAHAISLFSNLWILISRSIFIMPVLSPDHPHSDITSLYGACKRRLVPRARLMKGISILQNKLVSFAAAPTKWGHSKKTICEPGGKLSVHTKWADAVNLNLSLQNSKKWVCIIFKQSSFWRSIIKALRAETQNLCLFLWLTEPLRKHKELSTY